MQPDVNAVGPEARAAYLEWTIGEASAVLDRDAAFPDLLPAEALQVFLNAVTAYDQAHVVPMFPFPAWPVEKTRAALIAANADLDDMREWISGWT